MSLGLVLSAFLNVQVLNEIQSIVSDVVSQGTCGAHFVFYMFAAFKYLFL